MVFLRRRPSRAAVIAVLIAMLIGTMPVAAAKPTPGCDNRTNNTYAKLLECVTLEGVREHQNAFQQIADANGGTRHAGETGYTAPVSTESSESASNWWVD